MLPATERTDVIAHFEELRYGMFLHFGMSTFTGEALFTRNCELPLPPSETYAPPQVDADQWMQVASDAGMRYAVLTAKHNIGHCLWPTECTDYSVTTSGNTTDAVGAFIAACHVHDIAPCLYYNLGKDVAHRRDKGMTDDEYQEHAINQITELLTRYGSITQMWLDGPMNFPAEGRPIVYDTIKSLQPDCLVIMNQAFKDGTKIVVWPTDITNGEVTLPPPEGHNPHIEVDGTTYYIPMEVCERAAKTWFWEKEDTIDPLDELLQLYNDCMARNANLLLDLTPDKQGRLPQCQVDRMGELAEAIAAGE